ncbi:MAG: hypothetical protein RQ757_07245 [Pseudomonadales bacterium]|nr:hypothetical protein [Pseudomonadales bacterium]
MYACLDLGSNSFHLLVARWNEGQVDIVERFSEKVQLGEGVADSGKISDAAFERGLVCLRNFKQAVDRYPIQRYWALGTNALRVAANAGEFIEAAASIGFRISIISGIQEATLVYAGVVSSLPPSNADRLVIDIGGGSTEIIIGNGRKQYLTESLPVGCVSWRDRWFSQMVSDEGVLAESLNEAVTVAATVFQSIKSQIDRYPFTEVYASSGTAKMLTAICLENGFGNKGIHFSDLMLLRPQILSVIATDLPLPGLKDDRRDLVLSGWAVLVALMQTYAINTISFSPTALREGMLDFMVHHADRDGDYTDFLPGAAIPA